MDAVQPTHKRPQGQMGFKEEGSVQDMGRLCMIIDATMLSSGKIKSKDEYIMCQQTDTIQCLEACRASQGRHRPGWPSREAIGRLKG